MSRATARQSSLVDGILEVDPVDFRNKFNRISFELGHHLATEPLFQLPAVIDLGNRIIKTRPRDLHYDAGAIRVGQRWDAVPMATFAPEEALRRIENCGAWFILKAAQKEPEYKLLLDRCLAEIAALLGKRINTRLENLSILLTSPQRISSYHIDADCNFLLQVQGTKTIYIFDREDRAVLPEEELERFWSLDHNAATYKPQLQDRAVTYKLRPHKGVHVPVNCPHWVQNDDNISISLSFNFEFQDNPRANCYRANFLLRKLGMHPTPPGKSAALDAIKSHAVMLAVRAKRAFNRLWSK
jgi:hypothetical protein